MGLLDMLKANPNVTQDMRDTRGDVLMGLGTLMSQVGAGQAPNISPIMQSLDARKQSAQMRKVLDTPGMMDGFTPQQRAILAQMPEGMAVEMLMQNAFQPPPEPVRGVEVGGQIVDPVTGRVIYEGQPERTKYDVREGPNGELIAVDPYNPTSVQTVMGAPDKMGAGYIVSGQGAADLGLNPDFSYNITSGPEGMKADQIGPTRTAVDQEPPVTRQIKLADGSEALVQWDDATMSWVPSQIPQGGTGAQPRSKLTESQARVTLFETLQTETAPVLNQIEAIWNPANIPDAVSRATPIAGNFFQSAEGQIYNTAAAAWAEGALRISTGAAATQPEIARVTATYFAQPGDTPATVAFKSQMRDLYERAIRRSLGENGVPGKLVLPNDFARGVAAPVSTMTREEALKLLEP